MTDSFSDTDDVYVRYDERPLIELRHVLAERHVLEKETDAPRESVEETNQRIQALEQAAGVEGVIDHLPPTEYELGAARHRLSTNDPQGG